MAGFSWAAAADVGTGIASAISAWGSASASRIVSRANAEADRVVREAQNKQRAAGLSLAATMREQAYRAGLKNAGQQSNDAAVLIARSQEAWTGRRFEMGLQFAEQSGAFAARAAASGVGGASIRAVSFSQELQQSRVLQQAEERQGQSMYELIKQRAGIMPAAVSRLDVSPLTANQDYTPSFAPAGNGGTDLLGFLATALQGKTKSLQVALDSISPERVDTTVLPTGDFARADRATFTMPETSTIQID